MYNNFENNRPENNEGLNNVNETVNQEHANKKKPNGLKRGIAYTLVFGLVAGSSFGGITLANKYFGTSTTVQQVAQVASASTETDESSTGTTATILSTSSVADADVSDVSEIAEAVLPSLVAITCSTTETYSMYGQSQSQESVSSGTGIIVSQDNEYLYIATNNHVVDGADSVKLTFSDDSSVDAEVKGTAASSDLAVVQCKIADLSESTLSSIRLATLGSSDDSKVGELVVAIGNSLGYGQTVTVGYLSAKDREVQTDDYTMNLLQTDAAINPGNSGGALLNASGQVIGINSAKLSSTEVEGVGYAIPITYAIPIINDIISSETVSEEDRGYLGIRYTEVTDTYSSAFGLPEGVFVNSVISGSPAEDGGLQTGDVITAIDGRTSTTADEFQEILSTKAAGTEVTFTVQRASGNSYKETEVKITLGNKADYDTSSSSESGSSSNSGSDSSDSSQSQSPYSYVIPKR